MEIFLTKQCESFTGSLGKGFGYYIHKRSNLNGKTRFWGVRQAKGEIPADGHLRFIFACADLAKMKTHITDICVSRRELSDALWDAGREQISNNIFSKKFPEIFSAADVLTLKNRYNL